MAGKGANIMWKKRKRTEKILFLSPEAISPNPWSPRRKFSPDGMDRLSRSIARYGILQPLLVQKKGDEYVVKSHMCDKQLRNQKEKLVLLKSELNSIILTL